MNDKIVFVIVLMLIIVGIFSGCTTESEYKKGKTFHTDVYSFDNNIVFVMGARDIDASSKYFDCWINGKEINSSCYRVYHETNKTYAKRTFVIVFCDANGNNFVDGQLVTVSAMYSHPDWDYDYYNDLNICGSCMKINEGWYPYGCL